MTWKRTTWKKITKKTTNKAFVHCWILPGGALQVFQDLIAEEKDNNINYKVFTLTSDRDFLEIKWFTKPLEVITALPKIVNKVFQYFSFYKTPILSFLFDYRNLMLIYPFLMKNLSKKIIKYKPDDIIISSFAIAKNISITKKKLWKSFQTKLYLHSPMQYIWSHHEEYIKKITGFKKIMFTLITKRLRRWDKKFLEFDKIIFNSKYTQRLAGEIYNMDGQVKYPKIDQQFMDTKSDWTTKDYYIYTGRLTVLVKEVDKIIKLFNKTKQFLIIMWSGPDKKILKEMALDNILFVERIDKTTERIEIIKQAKWFINITKESFGKSTVEALLLWVPVFGYADWASLELVDHKSWVLVKKKTSTELLKEFNKFDKNISNNNYNKDEIRWKILDKLGI